MNLKECYNAFGGNYNDMLARLMTEERIRKFLLMFPKDTSFANLCEAMNDKNYELAFRSAHTLKGLCLNLGIDRLRSSSEAITEALRGNCNNGADELLPQVVNDYNLVIEAINELD